MVNKNIYMDYGATTPVRREVLEVMLPYWSDYYGNPSSVHKFGQQASLGLREARETIAKSLGCHCDEIVFTACGSESDNLALRGAMWSARMNGRGNHMITSQIEHKAVLETAIQLQRNADFEVTILPVDKYGCVDIDQLEQAIRPDTVLISIMAANNEIGTFQPIEEIGMFAREHGVLFHTDAVQAIPFRAWKVNSMPIDLMSIAPHKFYGPKGIGILYVRRGHQLVSTLTGGGQEDDRRAGTENVAYAVGSAEALRLAVAEREENVAHYQSLTSRLISGLVERFPETCRLTGHPFLRLPNNASFAFRNISGNDIVFHLDVSGVSASSGSACLTGDPKPSTVLGACGLSHEWTSGGLRLTVGRFSTKEDVEYLLTALSDVIGHLEALKAHFA
ncbi:MAG TPA: cysteine desulfurase family protein [Patescibacteria group bacterium]|nr:cysteine desulfurase family protein [Patescibacteria group bacterium]